jgi:hypothetical protein
MLHDFEAWEKYPNYHNWFNKLWLSERLGYNCGPCGTTPKESGTYIVRPIYNLSGMGVGASLKQLTPGDFSQVPPGYFWCEVLTGNHFSATFEFQHDVNPYWKPISCFQGARTSPEMYRFSAWQRTDYFPPVPRIFNELCEIKRINIEFKGDSAIEVHLRDSPDPDYDEIIPVWKGDEEKGLDIYTEMGYTYIQSYDDADGFLKTPRLGFMVK